jgi:hypothetical protein
MKPIYIWGALVAMVFLIGWGIHFAWITDTRYHPKPPVMTIPPATPIPFHPGQPVFGTSSIITMDDYHVYVRKPGNGLTVICIAYDAGTDTIGPNYAPECWPKEKHPQEDDNLLPTLAYLYGYSKIQCLISRRLDVTACDFYAYIKGRHPNLTKSWDFL